MYRYKRLLVGLNLTDLDTDVIRYAGLISRMARSERVYFAYICEFLHIPPEICEEYPEILEHPCDLAEDKMTEKVKEHFDGLPDTKIRYEVAEGSPLAELLRRTGEKDIDLVIVGRQREKKAGGMLPEKLARKAPCSVLNVPQGSEPAINSILAALDFSDNSEDVLDVTIAFGAAADHPSVRCLHVYEVPTGYYKCGMSYEEFAEVMKGHAEKAYQKLAKKIDFKGLEITPDYVLHHYPSVAIREAAKRHQADLIITGARGRSAASAVILGSVTERLLWTSEVPLLAVKRKGTGMSLLKALLNL